MYGLGTLTLEEEISGKNIQPDSLRKVWKLDMSN